MSDLSDNRRIARLLCRLATDDCVMDEKPKRPPCTLENCRMMPIARAAIAAAKEGE
jgi:hypothetical protein